MAKYSTEIPITPREFLSAAADILGETYLIKLFSVGRRSVERWTAKRPYVCEDSIRENPIEKYEILLERLSKKPGGLEIARASVDRLAVIVGCELTPTPMKIRPDKQSIEAECLDDYPALTAFHQAIQAGDPDELIRKRMRDALEEIRETAAAYLSVKQKATGGAI